MRSFLPLGSLGPFYHGSHAGTGARSEPSATRTHRVAWSGVTRCSGGIAATHRSSA